MTFFRESRAGTFFFYFAMSVFNFSCTLAGFLYEKKSSNRYIKDVFHVHHRS